MNAWLVHESYTSHALYTSHEDRPHLGYWSFLSPTMMSWKCTGSGRGSIVTPEAADVAIIWCSRPALVCWSREGMEIDGSCISCSDIGEKRSERPGLTICENWYRLDHNALISDEWMKWSLHTARSEHKQPHHESVMVKSKDDLLVNLRNLVNLRIFSFSLPV